MAQKYKNKFLMSLAVITVITLALQALADFGIVDWTGLSAQLTAVILGFGLMLEGNLRGILKILSRKNFGGEEFVHMGTGILGLIVFISGLMGLAGIAVPAGLIGVVGVAKSIAVVAVILELFI